MKKLLLILALLWCLPSHGAVVYACACGVGAASGCTPGSNTSPYDTPAKSMTSLATYATKGSALAAGDHLSTCQGGAFDNATNIQVQNTNATKSNPVYFDSYDDTSRWVGGAGIRPRFNSTAAGWQFQWAKSTLVHTEGYVIDGLDFEGDGVNTTGALLLYGDDDYVTLNNVKISGSTSAGLECLAAATGPATATNDGITSHLIVQNSVISNNKSIGILSSCFDTLIQGSTFTLNGTSLFDHDIYIGGGAFIPFSQTISSITGNGTTATMTTAAPHGIAIGARMTIAVTGSTSSGSGTFNVASTTIGTVTGPSTITYPATGTPSASVVGTYAASVGQLLSQFVIRNNAISEAVTGSGTCNLAHIVVHGNWSNGLIENNSITETAAAAAGSCVGVEIDTGGYSPPEDYEGFFGMVVRGNLITNTATGIGLDQGQRTLVENNFFYSSFYLAGVNDALGIISRDKGGSPIATGQQNPDQITIRYNTIYLTSAGPNAAGVTINKNVSDPSTGAHHNIYGNAVVFNSPNLTTGSQCYSTTNLLLTQFDVIDYNACYYTGATAPAWRNSSSLATVQGGGGNTGDLHSLNATTASVTTGQPFFTSPTTTPAFSTSSALKNAGSAILFPSTSFGGFVRNQGTADIGAYEFGATTVRPNSPTRIGP